MENWIKSFSGALRKRVLVPIVAVAMVVSLAAYEFVRPAKAAAPAAAAAGLDDNSVSALLSLDRAMETLAARVTPATVNVTVTSKASADHANIVDSEGDDDDSNGLQQFFGPFGPFGGQMPHCIRPQPPVMHGLGSGVFIPPGGYLVTNHH